MLAWFLLPASFQLSSDQQFSQLIKVQKASQNYFELFAIPESFEVDQGLLADKYRALQGEWHPDRFASADEPGKLQAVKMSSLLNQAFTVLQEPLSRAGYLLTLKGCDIAKVQQEELGMDLLLEQMQLREALEELPEDDTALETLDRLKTEVNEKLAACQRAFSEQLEVNAIAAAKKSFHELQFLAKLLKEIEICEEQRLDY